MTKDQLKVGSHVVLVLGNGLSDSTNGTKPIEGVYVGVYHDKGLGYDLACVRDNDDQIAMFLFGEHLILDYRYHNDPKLDGPDYGPPCACGHPYGRHFDGYHRDPLYPKLAKRASCKYCGCGLFDPVTAENQLNRLHKHRDHDLRITRDVECSVYERSDKPWIERRHEKHEEKKIALKAGSEYLGVSVTHANGDSYFVEGNLADGTHLMVTNLPADCFEVTNRRWTNADFQPREDDLIVESYQPEHLRLTAATVTV